MGLIVFLFGIVTGVGLHIAYLQQDEIKITFKVEKKNVDK